MVTIPGRRPRYGGPLLGPALVGLAGWAMLFGLCARVRAQTAAPTRPAHLAREITCVAGEPVVSAYDTAAAQYGVTEAENVAHEAAHLRQLASECDSVMARWARDPVARLEAEVEATCAGIAGLPPTQRAIRRTRARRVLFELYGPGLPADSGPPFGVLYAAFERWCFSPQGDIR